MHDVVIWVVNRMGRGSVMKTFKLEKIMVGVRKGRSKRIDQADCIRKGGSSELYHLLGTTYTSAWQLCSSSCIPSAVMNKLINLIFSCGKTQMKHVYWLK